MSTSTPLAGMFPGLDFMQQAASGTPAGSLPGMGSWLPTLDPKELTSRINELKTVLFWLEQNTAIVKSTIQALEVQKMTLGTLGAMNVGMAEMAKAFTMPAPAQAKGGQGAPTGVWAFASPVGGAAQAGGDAAKAAKDGGKGKQAAAGGTAPALTPAEQMAASMAAPAQMWWNALNAQFQQLAGNVAQQQAAVEAATAKATAKVAETAAEVAEAAAGMAAAAVPGGKSAAAKKRAASSKAEEKDK